MHVSQVCFSVGRTKGQHYVISLCAGLPIDFHKEFGLKTDDRVQPKLKEEQPINKGRWVGDGKVIPSHQDILPIFFFQQYNKDRSDDLCYHLYQFLKSRVIAKSTQPLKAGFRQK